MSASASSAATVPPPDEQSSSRRLQISTAPGRIVASASLQSVRGNPPLQAAVVGAYMSLSPSSAVATPPPDEQSLSRRSQISGAPPYTAGSASLQSSRANAPPLQAAPTAACMSPS